MWYLLGAVVVLAALAFVALPLLRPRKVGPPADVTLSLAEQRAEVYRELLDLELDQRVGKLDEADYRAQSDVLLARAAALMSAEDSALREVDEQIEREIAAQRAALRAAGPVTERDGAP
jgi:hypothetical protein